MNQKPTDLPLQVESPEVIVRQAAAGPMTVQCMEFGAGFDMAPVLVGLPDDMCTCPHWGYVLEGCMLARQTGGEEYRIAAGETYYLAPGHTVRFEERTRYFDFSPTEAVAVVGAHIQRRMATLAGAPS